jgi:leucyl aminopeptidase
MPMHRINDLAVRSAELADISNAPDKNKYGSSSSAPNFLNTFVNNQSKFIHLDIAATGIDKNRATGAMVKGLINYFVDKGLKHA